MVALWVAVVISLLLLVWVTVWAYLQDLERTGPGIAKGFLCRIGAHWLSPVERVEHLEKRPAGGYAWDWGSEPPIDTWVTRTSVLKCRTCGASWKRTRVWRNPWWSP